jgi:hypothetical protein
MLPLTWCACYFPKIIILRFEVISEKIRKKSCKYRENIFNVLHRLGQPCSINKILRFRFRFKYVKTYIEVLLQMDQLVLKHIHDLLPSCLSIRYDDAIGSTRSDANHFLKCRVLEGLNWLYTKSY